MPRPSSVQQTPEKRKGYVPCRRDRIAWKLACWALGLATPAYRNLITASVRAGLESGLIHVGYGRPFNEPMDDLPEDHHGE